MASQFLRRASSGCALVSSAAGGAFPLAAAAVLAAVLAWLRGVAEEERGEGPRPARRVSWRPGTEGAALPAVKVWGFAFAGTIRICFGAVYAWELVL